MRTSYTHGPTLRSGFFDYVALGVGVITALEYRGGDWLLKKSL